jgi:hypothetical protein
MQHRALRCTGYDSHWGSHNLLKTRTTFEGHLAVIKLGPEASDQQYGYIWWLLFRARNPGPFQGPQTDAFPWSCVAFWFDTCDNTWSWRLHPRLFWLLYSFC